jgi:uncharacterized GH25 family protein
MQTRIKYLLITTFISITLFSVAHEYWIAPVKYKVKSKEAFSVNCYVGEDFKEEVWAKRKERTSQVNIFHKKTKNDITPKFIDQDSVKIPMFLNKSGNHLIAISTKPSYIEMEGAAFNDYLKEDGMTNILSYRAQNNLKDKRSREYYQRCAKTLLQVDDKNDDSYKINTGMQLEIIPQSNPFANDAQELNVYFEFKGKPLANYQVRTWCKKNGKLIVKAFHQTDATGFAKLPIKEKGEWMISVVKMELYTATDKADYESYWGSYTFYNN